MKLLSFTLAAAVLATPVVASTYSYTFDTGPLFVVRAEYDPETEGTVIPGLQKSIEIVDYGNVVFGGGIFDISGADFYIDGVRPDKLEGTITLNSDAQIIDYGFYMADYRWGANSQTFEFGYYSEYWEPDDYMYSDAPGGFTLTSKDIFYEDDDVDFTTLPALVRVGPPPSPVPLPASGVMILAAMGGLFGWRKVRRS